MTRAAATALQPRWQISKSCSHFPFFPGKVAKRSISGGKQLKFPATLHFVLIQALS
jgi:hypothetical protein